MSDMRTLLKKAMELVQPDLRKYYRVLRKGKIVAAYASSGGQWFADVQPLRNDESPDTSEPILPKLELPVLWGGINRGVACPPKVGTLCAVSYWDGDPSYPYISAIRWFQQGSPDCGIDEFIIQAEPGVSIKIDKVKKIITLTTSDIENKAGADWKIEAGGNVSIKAGGEAKVQAPKIILAGNIETTGASGGPGTCEISGAVKIKGTLDVSSTVNIGSSLSVGGGINGKVNGCSGCGS